MRKHAQRDDVDWASRDLPQAEVGPANHRLPRQGEEITAQAQGMEAMGRLAGGIAHVFNNLLTAMACETELALIRLAPDDPARKHLREIERVSERGAALARQLLAFSGRQVLQPKLVQINNLLTTLDDKLRRVLGDQIELRMDLDPDVGRVKVDPGQMEQAILNLISNARDVMPQGGQVAIETRLIEVRPNMSHPLRAFPGRYVQIKVTDTGPGMADEIRRRVFEPFFTTKQGPEATGLGLSTAYGIVSQSGGHIVADSEPGKGARFLILLPSGEIPAGEEGEISGRPWETILLVEDEDNIRRPLSEILKARGYNVLEAADAAQAIEISKRHTGPIHLMVTDILMNGMTGVELAEQLSYDRAGMKVLFATGYPAGLAEGSRTQEDAPLLKKPFTGRDLAAKVREVLEAPDSGGLQEMLGSESPVYLEPAPFDVPPTEESLDVSAVAGERSQLLARKHGGQKLSPNEKERLELLTARLEELLPPISANDLEILLTMTEEMEHIRERAQERRRRLELN